MKRLSKTIRNQNEKKRNKKRAGSVLKTRSIDLLFFLFAGALYALSVNLFTAPNHIAPGGATGIATVVHSFFNLPIGMIIIMLNVPLFIFSFKKLGIRFTLQTALATVILSAAIDLLAFIPPYTGNVLLAALYGGLLSGAALGFVFMRGATSGGSDLLARLIRMKFLGISMGQIILMIDFVIIAGAALAYQNFESVLYAIITIFVSSKVIDNLLYGFDKGQMYIIVSERHDEIAKAVIQKLGRGVTILNGSGYYTNQDKRVVLCAVRRFETTQIRRIILDIDPRAFIVISEAGEILGEGFKTIDM